MASTGNGPSVASEPVTISAHAAEKQQSLAYFPGDGTCLWLDDKTVGDETLKPVERAVLVARLRSHAALIEDNGYR